MVHQMEEHTGHRFHRYVKFQFGRDRDVLATEAIDVTNVAGVWIVCGVALYLARYRDLGLGLIPAYLVLINAAIHVLAAVKMRAYNPGPVTGLVLVLPLGSVAMTVVAPHAMLIDHAIALVVAAGGHLAIVAVMLGRQQSPATPSFATGE